MKFRILVTFLLSFQWGLSNAQTDAPETLQWVEQTAMRIDTLLKDAILMPTPVQSLMKMVQAYRLFDALVKVGLHSRELRAAAHDGLRLCDIVNYDLERDINSLNLRATQAREDAETLRRYSSILLKTTVDSLALKAPTPHEILFEFVELAEMDLRDGMSTKNAHIFAQKVEHAIVILHDIEHLAISMDDCIDMIGLSQKTVKQLEKVLVAPNWIETNKEYEASLVLLAKMKKTHCLE